MMEVTIHDVRREIILEKAICTREAILDIPKWMLPMPVFAYDPGAFFSFATAAKTKGQYGHFMWLIERNGQYIFASQSWWFQSVPVIPANGGPGHYDKYLLKFCYNPAWTPAQRAILTNAIQTDLDKPFYRTLYDIPQIFGHLIGLKWIQIPGFEVCSDRSDYFILVDGRYNLKRPTPTDVNRWMKAFLWVPEYPEIPGYTVYGRYNAGD